MNKKGIASLHKATLEIMRQMDSAELLTVIIQQAADLLRAIGGGIFKCDPNKRELEIVADWNAQETLKGHKLKYGEGVAGFVAETKKPLRVPDYDSFPGRSKEVKKGLFKAVVGVPLLLNETVLGVIYIVDTDEDRTFSKDDEQLLEFLATYAAVAISKANTLDQLKTLHEINLRITTAATLEDVLKKVLAHGLKAIGTDEGSIMYVNRDTGELEMRVWMIDGELMRKKPHTRLKLDEGIAGHVVETCKPYNCENTEDDPHFIKSFTGRTLKSLLCVPIRLHGQVLYVLNADSAVSGFFNKENEHFLTSLAERAAGAIESQNLRDSGVWTTTLDGVLEDTVKRVCVLAGMDASTIFLKDADSDEIERKVRYPKRAGYELVVRRDGLTREILNGKERLLVLDAQNDPSVRQSVKDEGVQVILGVPIWSFEEQGSEGHEQPDPKIVGALFANAKSALQEDEIKRRFDALETLSSYASIGLRNASLLEGEKHRAQRLHQTSLEITDELRMPRLGKLILNRAVELLQADGGALYLTEPGGTVKVAAISNLPDNFLGQRLPIDKGLHGIVIETGKASFKLDYSHWEGRLQELSEENLDSVAGAPIQWQGTTYGAIAVHDRVPGRTTFTDEELNLLSHLGNMAAVALKNAQQTDRLEKLMDSSFDAIIAVDETGTITRINDTAKEILDNSPEALEGKYVVPLYYDEEAPRTIKRLLHKNEDGTPNLTGKLKDHYTFLSGTEKIPILLSASVLYGWDGEPAGSVGFFRDLRKEEKDKSEIRYLESLLAASRVAASTTSLPAAVQAICDAAKISIKGVTAVALYLYDNDRGEITVRPPRAGVDHPDIWIGPTAKDSPILEVIRKGKTKLIKDAQDSIVSGAFIPEIPVQSCVIAPLKIGTGKPLGVMFLLYEEPHAFTETEEFLVRMFARHAAVMVENASLYEATRRQSEEMKAIREREASLASLSNLSGEETSLRNVLRLLADHARELTHAEYGALAVVDEHGKIKDFVAAGLTPEQEAEIIDGPPTGIGLLGLLRRKGESMNLPDVSEHPRFTSFPAGHPPIKGFLGVAIDYHRSTIGSFYVGNKQGGTDFTEADYTALRQLASHAAIAIENARLYETTEQSLARAEGLRKQINELVRESQGLQETCLKLAESVDPRELLNPLMQSVLTMRAASSGSILLYDSLRNDFVESLRCNSPNQVLTPYQTSVTQFPNDIAYTVIKTGEQVFESDIRNDDRFSEVARQTWRSVVALPLRIENRPIGVLYINWNEHHEFSEREKRFWDSLTTPVSQAIQSFRTREMINASQNIHAAMQLFSRLGHTIDENGDALSMDLNTLEEQLPSKIFDRILNRMKKVIGSSRSIKNILGVGSKSEPTDLKKLLPDVVEKLCEKRSRRGQHIIPKVELPAGNCLVDGNPMLVKTAIEILVENAIRSIKDKTGEIAVKLSVDQEIARAEVYNNGRPVKLDILRDVASYQATTLLPRRPGYPLAASILKTHKGDIRLVRTNESGTTFEFWLPISKDKPTWRQTF